MTPRWLFARVLFMLCLVAAAANHGLLAGRGEGEVARHALFVVVDLVAGALILLRPRRVWVLVLIGALAAQQLYSHGVDLIASFRGSSPGVDWPSLGIVIYFPALVLFLVLDLRRRGTGT